MSGTFHHEALFRGGQPLGRLAEVPLTLCGAGALGSHLADNLARQGCGRLRVIDHDRVEERNVGTQLYGESEVGLRKVEALRHRLFRAVGVEVEAVPRELTARNARGLLAGSGLVIDAFDNAPSRRAVRERCRADGLPCLHVGLADGYAEVVWDDDYRLPEPEGLEPEPDSGAADACAPPLARNLVLLAVAVASEAVVRYLLEGTRGDWSITLEDLAIRPLEPHHADRPRAAEPEALVLCRNG